jgi:predicted transcriptional regulator
VFEKRIDIFELQRLIREGNSQGQCARLIGVSKQAVSATLKRLKQENDRSALSVSPPVAKALVGSKIDGMKQLKKINDVIIHEINILNEKIKKAQGEERETLTFQRLKHVGEIRKQLGLLLEICKELYNAEEVQHFQQTVLDCIGEVNEDVQNEIIRRLKLVRSTRSVFSGS